MNVVSSRIFLNEPGLCWINRFQLQHPESLALFIRAYSRIKVILVYLGLSCEIHRSSNHWHRFRQVIGPRKCFCNHMWPQLSVRQNHVIQSFCILNLTNDLFRICGYRISTVSVCLNSTVIFFSKMEHRMIWTTPNGTIQTMRLIRETHRLLRQRNISRSRSDSVTQGHIETLTYQGQVQIVTSKNTNFSRVNNEMSGTCKFIII